MRRPNRSVEQQAKGGCHALSPAQLKKSSLVDDLIWQSSVEEAEDLATGVLAAGLLVVHDAERGRQHDVSELLEKMGGEGGGKKRGGEMRHDQRVFRVAM